MHTATDALALQHLYCRQPFEASTKRHALYFSHKTCSKLHISITEAAGLPPMPSTIRRVLAAGLRAQPAAVSALFSMAVNVCNAPPMSAEAWKRCQTLAHECSSLSHASSLLSSYNSHHPRAHNTCMTLLLLRGQSLQTL